MKKIFLSLMLLSALSLQAQSTSRIMIGLGGGFSTNLIEGRVDNICGPMGTFNFGYAILGSVNSSTQLGLRTGVNASYSQFANAIKLDNKFTNYDYYGHQMDYTVASTAVTYRQSQINVEVPIMFAVRSRGVYFNVGAKFVAPVWNQYKQTIDNPTISAFYPEYGVTVVNDVVTGRLTDEQINLSGKATVPYLMIGLAAEIGHVWALKGSNSSLGFDIFLDYMPWSIGASKENTKSIVEVAPLVNDCEQPKAAVTVNPMFQCNNYAYQNLNFGIKLVYTFDIDHKRTEIPEQVHN